MPFKPGVLPAHPLNTSHLSTNQSDCSMYSCKRVNVWLQFNINMMCMQRNRSKYSISAQCILLCSSLEYSSISKPQETQQEFKIPHRLSLVRTCIYIYIHLRVCVRVWCTYYMKLSFHPFNLFFRRFHPRLVLPQPVLPHYSSKNRAQNSHRHRAAKNPRLQQRRRRLVGCVERSLGTTGPNEERGLYICNSHSIVITWITDNHG